MGEPPCPGGPPPGGCCLDSRESVILLVALSLLGQVALTITAAVGARLWRLLAGLLAKAPPSPPPAARKSCLIHPPAVGRGPPPELALPRPCPLCPRRPLKLSVDVNLRREPGRPRPEPAAPGPCPGCTCPRLPRPRPAGVSRGTDPPGRPAPGVRFRPARRETPASSGSEGRDPRPTKVYIYPVQPATPPASRDPSPARRGGRGAAPGHGGAEETAPPGGRPRYYQAEEPSTADWVYRPIKGPQWDWKQGG